MVDIDERVVSMKFDSSDFEKKSKSTLDTLDKLNDKMTFKDAANGDVLERIADNVEKMAHKSYNIVDMWVEKIKNNIIDKFDRFLKENTIGQLQAGWSKYADMTTSVATLKAQGYAMEQITDQLERLNYFTDETSYQFTKMVGEIGKFTASGQSLEDATTAMMGIAEWAALSGKNANEASRAMYQLSQALGAGTMRLIDYKSIQNLNMDTVEFRKNAIEAAIAVGTLKDNLNGTYTSLINNKVTFSLQNFAESLSQGKWFNSEVMMRTYTKYSEAVDEIRAIYEEGSYMDAEGNYTKLNTTAEAVKLVKENNEKLVARFQKTELKADQINDILKRWKKVEKVTKVTAQEYEAMDDAAKEQLKTMQAQQQENYAAYLKEYAEVFTDAEESAEEALEKWHTYVSDYGIKAFNAAQEAKTFTEAIESAKDAASTVWTTIYTTVFGNYNEAKELWTDLANALYEIFVNRLWDLNDVFEYWKTGGASALENMLDEYEKELAALQSKTSPAQDEIDRMRFLEKEIEKIETELDTVIYNEARTTKTELQGIIDDYEKELEELKSKESITDFDKKRIKEIEEELVKLNAGMENSIFVNGRKMMFQGIYAIGSGLKSLILNFRKGWDEVTTDNQGGKKLLAFSEKIRISGFRFYTFMKNLGATSFFRNIALGIQHLMAPINGIKQIIKSVISQFIPAGQTIQDTLNKIAAKFEKITRIFVPTQTFLLKVARIFRGLVSVIKIVAKAIVGVYQTFIKPVLQPILDALSEIAGIILEIAARVGDVAFEIDKASTPLTAMNTVGRILTKTLGSVWQIIKRIAMTLLRALGPIIGFLINSLKELWETISNIFNPNDGESLLDKFDKWVDKIKKAWNSTASLAQVFEAFRGGKGIGNFITMLGAMLDTLVTKIGVTILAIFGLDEATSQTHIGQALQSLKSVIVGIATVIRWLYTNVIRPILIALFKGVASAADDLVDAFKKGDFIGILNTLTKIIKTSGLLQLVKLLRIIIMLLGSRGLMKIIRNAAAALKSLKKWLDAKYYNEMASVFLKLAVSIGIFIGIALGLTFLPIEKLHQMGTIIGQLSVALLGLIAVLIVMSRFVEMSKIGLLSFAMAMFSIVALVFVFVYAANKLNEVLSNLFVNSKGEATKDSVISGIFKVIMGLAPLILGVIGIIKLIKVVTVLGVPGLLSDFGITVAAIAASVGLLMIGLEKLSNVIQNASVGNVIASVAIILIMLVVFMKALGSMFKTAGSGIIGGTHATVKSGLATAISIVAIVASVSFILVPLLEDLSNNIDKFPEYMLALIEVCGSIVSITWAFSLMTKGFAAKGGWATILAAGIVFERLMKVLKDYMSPLINEMTKLGLEAFAALPGLAILGGFLYLVSLAIKKIFDGINDLIRAFATVNPKAWIPMALNVAIIMGTLAGIIFLFDTFDINMKVSDVLMLVGSVVAILMALGLFAKIADIPNAVRQDNIRKTFNSMTILVAVIMAGMAGIVAEVSLLYGTENYTKAQDIMRTFMLSVVGILVVMLGGLFLFMNNIAKTMGTLDVTKTTSLITSIKTCVWGLVAIIGLFSAGGLLAGLVYDNSEDYVSNVIAAAGSICGMILSFLIGVSIFVLALNSQFGDSSWGQITGPHKLKALVAGLIALVSTIAIISLLFMPALKNLTDVPYENILSATIGVSLIIFVLMGMITTLSKSIVKGDFDLVGLVGGLAGFIISFIVVIKMIPTLFEAFNSIRGLTTGDVIRGLAMMLVPLGALLWLISSMSAPGVGEMFLASCMKISTGLLLIAAAVSAIGLAFTMIRELIDPGTTFLSGYRNVQGMADGYRAGSKEYQEAVEDNSKDGQKTVQKTDDQHSPSRKYFKFGKNNVLGLAQGMKKNQKLAINASRSLAIVTNEGFCEELGIESPSKVFYENGRFVVRGFINGVNSLNNKNKQAGLDMADGFSEGMENAMNNMKDELSDLWDGFGMDPYITDAIEKAGSDAGGLFADSLFDNFFGGGSELSESEKQTYKIISNQFNNAYEAYRDNNKKYQNAVSKLEKAQTDYDNDVNNREKYSKLQAAKKALQDVENEVLNSFLDESDKKLKKNKGNAIDYRSMYNRITEMNARGAQGKLTTELTTTIGQVATNLMNDGDLLGLFNDVGGGLGGNVSLGFLGGLAETFGIDPEGDIGGQIKEKVNGWLSGFGLTGDIGTDVQNGITNLCGWITDESKEGGAIANAGQSFASGLFGTVKTAFSTWWSGVKYDITDFIMKNLTPAGRYLQRREENYKLANAYLDSLTGTENEKFGHMLVGSLINAGATFELTEEKVDQLFDDWLYAKETGRNISHFAINGSLISLVDAETEIGYDPKDFEDEKNRNNMLIEIDNETESEATLDYLESLAEMLEDNLSSVFDYHDLDHDLKNNTKYLKSIYKKGIEYNVLDMDHLQFNVEGNEEGWANFVNYVRTAGYLADEQYEERSQEINELLKSKDYKEIALTEGEVKDIWNYADVKLDAMRVSGETLVDKLQFYPEKVEDLLNYINNNIITLIKESDTSKELSIYEIAQMAGSKSKLDKLASDAKSGNESARKELDRLTNNLGYSKFMQNISERYNNLQTFMKNATPSDYENGNYNRWYNEAKFYEDKYLGAKKEVQETQTNASVITYETPEEWYTKNKGKVKDWSPWHKFLSDAQEKLPMEGETILEFFRLALKEKWIQIDQEGIMYATKFTDDMLDTMKDGLDENSPSQEAIEIMEYFMRGLGIGIDENIMNVLKTLSNGTDLMTKTTIAGLQAMANAAEDEEIQPTITPIYDYENTEPERLANAILYDPNKLHSKNYFDRNKDERFLQKMDYILDGYVSGLTDEELANIKYYEKLYGEPKTEDQRYIALTGKAYKANPFGLDDVIEKVYNTANSFKDTSINYTSQFDSLANGIVGTNLLLQTLCDTLQEGGLVDVNVNAEVDTNGLFDFVINKGKEKWKQTGKQQFKW